MKPAIFIAAILSLGAAAWAQPAIATGGVLNGASFTKGQAVAAGSLVSIFGTNLATTMASASSVPLSTSLGGVSVTFNNIAAPLVFVSPQRRQWRPDQRSGPVRAGRVRRQRRWSSTNGTASAPQTVQLAAQAPGIFFTRHRTSRRIRQYRFRFRGGHRIHPRRQRASGQDSRSANAGDSHDGPRCSESVYCRRRRAILRPFTTRPQLPS